MFPHPSEKALLVNENPTTNAQNSAAFKKAITVCPDKVSDTVFREHVMFHREAPNRHQLHQQSLTHEAHQRH
jgi:hypothetical protein